MKALVYLKKKLKKYDLKKDITTVKLINESSEMKSKKNVFEKILQSNKKKLNQLNRMEKKVAYAEILHLIIKYLNMYF